MEQKPFDRKSYFNDYNNRPEVKAKRQLDRWKKEWAKKEQDAKLYQASNIKVLMSLKEYTELDKEKQKLWLDFNWTLKDCKEGVADIVEVMKLVQVGEQLIKDYWATAKSEEESKKRNWNSYDYEEQKRAISYWGSEKARIENGFIKTSEKIKQEGKTYERDIEISKFHEEQGRRNCECWKCEEKQRLQKEITQKLFNDYQQDNTSTELEHCFNCDRMVKKLEETTGACQKCSESFND